MTFVHEDDNPPVNPTVWICEEFSEEILCVYGPPGLCVYKHAINQQNSL